MAFVTIQKLRNELLLRESKILCKNFLSKLDTYFSLELSENSVQKNDQCLCEWMKRNEAEGEQISPIKNHILKIRRKIMVDEQRFSLGFVVFYM